MIYGTGFATLDEREDAGEMKKPDALDAPRFTDGHGADETFCRPFVELRAGAAGIKFMPELWRSHPHRQIAFPVADKLCGAGLCRTVAIEERIALSAVQTAQRRDESTQRELATFDNDLGGAWLVPPADCA